MQEDLNLLPNKVPVVRPAGKPFPIAIVSPTAMYNRSDSDDTGAANPSGNGAPPRLVLAQRWYLAPTPLQSRRPLRMAK